MALTKVRPHQIVDGDTEWLNIHVPGFAVQNYFLVWEFEYAGYVESAIAYANDATASVWSLGISAGGVHGVGTVTEITDLIDLDADDNATGNTTVATTDTASRDFAVGSRLVLVIDSVGGTATDFVIQIKLKRDA